MLVEAAQASWAKGMALIADALFRARRGVMYISADRLSFFLDIICRAAVPC